MTDALDVHEEVRRTLAFSALAQNHVWVPYVCVCDGFKVLAYRRSDGAGHIVPNQKGDMWWPSWAHLMLCGGSGWHHDAFGRYYTKESAAMAFDRVYELERIAGNADRMTRDDRREILIERAAERAKVLG